MSDATIVTETPPLRAASAPIGTQAIVPITGNRAQRVLLGALHVDSGPLERLITPVGEALTWQAFLQQIRWAWRGWHSVLCIDRGSPHPAEDSQDVAHALGIAMRWLPIATPELNALEGLWREGKDFLANRSTHPIDESADARCQYLLALTPHQRLQKAGVCSGKFWLTN